MTGRFTHILACNALPRVALALLLPAALLLPQAALAQGQFRVPEDCDWTPLWPVEGASEVSPYRDVFYLNPNHRDCGIQDAVLTSEDGVESPMQNGSSGPEGTMVSVRRTDPGAHFPLDVGKTYAIQFNWFDSDHPDEASEVFPARPYTFTTAATDEGPPRLSFEDLTIERFEILPDEGRVILEAHWPDPSPLHFSSFGVFSVEEETPFQQFFYSVPALDAPDIRYELTDLVFLRGEQICAGLALTADSILPDEESAPTFSECIDRGCSSIAATPSVAWLAGLALVLVGRRRGGGR